MKKAIIIALGITFFLFSNINSALIKKASAADFSIGASTWYSWWKFSESENMKMKPTLVFGPVLSVGFGGPFSLSGVFLYGKFKPEKNDSNDGGPDYITRFDSDISLNYNINRYFKIFGGGKYMDFRWDEQYSSGKHYSLGPGLGIGLTAPLAGSFYFLTNVSGTYTLGNHEEKREESTGTVNSSTKITEIGINTNASVAYYIASASTSITLGFRYQYVISKYDDPDYNGENFSFYGPTLSVVFTF